jgi:hypothetical protein
MTPFEQQIARLKELQHEVSHEALPNGGSLIRISKVNLPPGWGWNRESTDILFVAPPGFPAAQPDCFWVEPAGFRLTNGGTPQASNDSNPIPGDTIQRSLTWFSWHLQSWNPNTDSLATYFNVIMQRLNPAR